VYVIELAFVDDCKRKTLGLGLNHDFVHLRVNSGVTGDRLCGDEDTSSRDEYYPDKYGSHVFLDRQVIAELTLKTSTEFHDYGNPAMSLSKTMPA
jgi:hypothetical protein